MVIITNHPHHHNSKRTCLKTSLGSVRFLRGNCRSKVRSNRTVKYKAKRKHGHFGCQYCTPGAAQWNVLTMTTNGNYCPMRTACHSCIVSCMVPILISFHGAQNCTLHAAIAEPCCRVQVMTRRNFPRYAYRLELRPNKKGAALCHHPDVVGSRFGIYCCMWPSRFLVSRVGRVVGSGLFRT